jgi:hypothetical protein
MKKIMFIPVILMLITMVGCKNSSLRGCTVINVKMPGTLHTLIANYADTITKLKITGTIDARDFVTMRDNMPSLAVVDMSAVNIAAYNGSGGTCGSTSYPANAMPDYSFYNPNTSYNPYTSNGKTTLTTILLPSSLTSIGVDAFWKCTGLTSVTIPNSVTSIGGGAFAGCRGLTSITIPSSATSIGTWAFQDCSGLITVDANNPIYSSKDGILFNKNQTTLIQCPISIKGSYAIPNSVTSIGNEAFFDCIGLTSVTIPNSVTSIERQAFAGCTGLTSVIIPSSVISIGTWAFSRYVLFTVDANNPIYSSKDGILFNKNQTTLIQCPIFIQGGYVIPNSVISIGDGAFQNCSGLTSVTIPNSVTSIGDHAFERCSGLTSVTIPNSVTSIGNMAFYNCRRLNTIYAYPTTPVDLSSSLSYDVFDGVNTSTCTLYVPQGSLSAYQAANQWSEFTHIVEM